MNTQVIILAGRQAGRQDSSVFLRCSSSIYIRRALPIDFVGGARLLIYFHSYTY